MNKAVRRWMLKAARKEQNPFVRAMIEYQILGETEK